MPIPVYIQPAVSYILFPLMPVWNDKLKASPAVSVIGILDIGDIQPFQTIAFDTDFMVFVPYFTHFYLLLHQKFISPET